MHINSCMAKYKELLQKIKKHACTPTRTRAHTHAHAHTHTHTHIHNQHTPHSNTWFACGHIIHYVPITPVTSVSKSSMSPHRSLPIPPQRPALPRGPSLTLNWTLHSDQLFLDVTNSSLSPLQNSSSSMSLPNFLLDSPNGPALPRSPS